MTELVNDRQGKYIPPPPTYTPQITFTGRASKCMYITNISYIHILFINTCQNITLTKINFWLHE